MSKRLRYLIDLSDGSVVTLTEPKDLAVFLNALPSLSAVQQAFRTISETETGLIGMPPVAPEVVRGIYPLLAEMADISVEEFADLGVFDKLAIMQGLSLFIPNGLATPRPDLPSPSTKAEDPSQMSISSPLHVESSG